MNMPWAIVLGSLILSISIAIAAGQLAAVRPPVTPPNRYAMVEAPGGAGIWRLDQRSGQVSLCIMRDKGMACVHVAQEVDAAAGFDTASDGAGAQSTAGTFECLTGRAASCPKDLRLK
jgi:hypothetical protein